MTLGLLCSFYAATPEEIGFTSTASRQALVPAGTFAGGSFGLRLDAVRRAVDRTLAAASISPAQLDLLDERILWARQQYVYTPPAPMMETLLGLLADVEDLAGDRQPAAVQVRLSELTAILSTLTADALMKLGDLARSQAWYGTARAAAEDSGNVELRARVRAQAAMLPFYYGPLEAAVALTREARMMTRGRPSVTAAFATAAEARALAKLGDGQGARCALRNATDLFERCASEDNGDDAFSFPERRFLLYRSGTLTALGDTRQARRVQARARDLYPTRTGIDPALLQLETAICAAVDQCPADACELAGSAILAILPAHRTPILRARAREVIRVLPSPTRSSRPVRELREILALTPGAR
ncbi:XRE family transcriptional regulator [Streptomyces sp. NBC_01808]|uniref:XRE family transcriptional regulator n=1 Tax=Streptomyces sp. NBC_01808 TaxID=2975947 RepID=UPI002DDA2D47|nr:XRE family transcriptional regulator [Streptomyces sp. NBC_01808]WSA37663.1 XRE family transcriptional regulator [Streptomyces sp. NBC_01808]